MGSPENLDHLKSAFRAMARGDAAATVAHYTEDYVVEFPYPVARGAFRVEGRDAVRDFLARSFEIFRFELEIDVVHPTGDPDLHVLEYRGRGRALATGKPYDNRYVGLWWFRDGLVRHTREYYDPGVAEEAVRA
jgi:ketosteroid isomerase-like protein